MTTNNIKVKELNNEYVTEQYENGMLTDKDVNSIYSYHKKNPGSLNLFGMNLKDLRHERKCCTIPGLAKFYDNAIKSWYEKQEMSTSQNLESMDKLNFLKKNACGMGLKKVLRKMKKVCRFSKDINAKIAYLLLSTEYANLSAKDNGCKFRQKIYERKEYLLRRLSPLLQEAGYRCGLSANPGKNAVYILYCYLPNGKQISWHTSWKMYDQYPPLDVEWDGQKCSTLTKLIDYITEEKFLAV